MTEDMTEDMDLEPSDEPSRELTPSRLMPGEETLLFEVIALANRRRETSARRDVLGRLVVEDGLTRLNWHEQFAHVFVGLPIDTWSFICAIVRRTSFYTPPQSPERNRFRVQLIATVPKAPKRKSPPLRRGCKSHGSNMVPTFAMLPTNQDDDKRQTVGQICLSKNLATDWHGTL
jgi:hypothetical protein